MPVEKCPSRARFQIPLKCYRTILVFERGRRPDHPGTKLRCVWNFPGIVVLKSILQVLGLARVNLFRPRNGLQCVHVVISAHGNRPASVSGQKETTAGSLRLSRDFWPASRSSSLFTSEGWWSRWVTLPHQPACKAGALLVCHDPEFKMAGCLRAARSKLSFGDSAAC